MGCSEADAEAASSNAVDSDGSVSWEDFFGTSTDLVPQLLGMFDELARRGNGYDHDHVVLSASCNIPAALQKRLSLVPHSQRGSIFGQLCGEATKKGSSGSGSGTSNSNSHREKSDEMCERTEETDTTSTIDVVVTQHRVDNNNEDDDEEEDEEVKVDKEKDGSRLSINVLEQDDKKNSYVQETNANGNGLNQLRYKRRCRSGRPLSGSSIASSTSSSGCSNQGNTCATNPYLASVESLADTCASSQGSGDSGVATVSEASCRIGNGTNGQRRDSTEGNAPCHRPRYCDPHRNPVERVLLEIIDTEAIYVEHLRQVIQGYLIFWRDNPTSFVHQLQLSDLFSNIEDIFEFNREFLKEIEKCSFDPVRLANTFIKHNSGFKVYTEYCTNYPRTVSVLTDLMGQEETAKAFRERQAALDHALPLGSFLLKPVQRILKYHLLLENLSKEYGADCDARENETEGRNAIEGALAAMTGIAKHINAMKRRHEHAVRVQEIQSLLYGWSGPDLTTSGELIAEGRFRMRGAKAPRHAFLFDRMLLLTKKKEDGLLVYKAHIMCSNLMLIESIPGEPLSFHVIPFDNPRLQYTLQARNLEQKREWTLQIKRVILENYNAVIPSHARQLFLQLGQTQHEDDSPTDKSSAKKLYSAPPEYLEKRKQERERRRSETGIRHKFKKGTRKPESPAITTENSPASLRKNPSHETEVHDSRDQNLNRCSDGRTLKVKDRFTGWRRKSEPGFQSYVCLNQSDEDQKEDMVDIGTTQVESDRTINASSNEESKPTNSQQVETKENNEQQTATTPVAQTVEEIVGHILMQNQEFQKLLEKQRTSSSINVRQQQRFIKRISADTSDESDCENANYVGGTSNNRVRSSHRESQRLVRTNNAWNTFSSSSARDTPQPALRLLYDNFKSSDSKTSVHETSSTKNNVNRVHEKRALFEAFKRQSIVTESKIIKTALRIRENSTSTNDDPNETPPVLGNDQDYSEKANEVQVCSEGKDKTDDNQQENVKETDESKGFGNYDNLQHVWEGLQEEQDVNGSDSPTRPAIWLTKLCEGLPTSPQKCGSLPRSFQINPNSPQPSVTKSRFLQRDGKPMTERPFTIASDKPAEINLEDMERYASSCQPEGRIAKFPTSVSTSTSTFFCSLDDTLNDAYSEIHMVSPTTTNIHPDHKIYRANGSTMFKNVLSKAGSRLQGLRNTLSTETLECSEEIERTKYFRSLSNVKSKRKGKSKHSRESSSDVEELVGCVSAGGPSDYRIPSLYYKQGSSSLGARIAQSDYADPTVLFAESKRNGQQASNVPEETTKKDENSKEYGRNKEEEEEEDEEESPRRETNRRESETDSFYERSFEIIENYVDVDVDEVFRDSAIFSDADDVLLMRSDFREAGTSSGNKQKVAPPVPAKKRSEYSSVSSTVSSTVSNIVQESTIGRPYVAQKPDYLKIKSMFLRTQSNNSPESKTSSVRSSFMKRDVERKCIMNDEAQNEGPDDVPSNDNDDVSAGQSQAGWVKKIVCQLQGHVET
ncbi:PREDICTED: uncharacterized protein LOC106787664 isoform X1 [Polistes canadensis]|uniref:uncharacterized protein LOC106787664 isoform X1 n=2 Tax=Polistes canadensis TaxID=91411 RepID=UPI000718B567|nr:PREDICTED: uncharacterized protein LOC106787664 isoform X1 [Polistes canadensis]XP_014605703.1 PREDICTED: uncharacterized protein LOC106787664 isoform X1 [Polistes canadensis]